ncbi:zinc finger protein MAGPIE-like [Hibiscus syriacus]|uniref:Zinc finger protein MAGPIE-like n=1 Tax=Hibiscus syriacus TaxID=106335 RepID=A0A6A3BHE6_HIBSY|nr:glutaredoxin-C9-like isoform X1 [Hibiscus syriacus]KAE8716456.1 zinc finger protein MAGPIE-like [Hibiscus syriacus]
MQQAIPYKSWPLPCISTTSHGAPSSTAVGKNNNLVISRGRGGRGGTKDVINIVSENAVIVLARKGCCMSHVVRRLLQALGVNPAVHEINEVDEAGVLNELEAICKDNGNDRKMVQLPVVFIGGRLYGGLDKVMATHISGELIPVLKDAGALWL